MKMSNKEIVITVATTAVTVLLFTLLIKNKLIELIMIQAINVMIIGLELSSVIDKIVKIITIKFKKRDKNDRAPFLPPMIIIKNAKIRVNIKITFIFLPSFYLRKIATRTVQ